MNVMLGRGLGGLEQAALDYGIALTARSHDVHTVLHPTAAIRPALEARLGVLPHTLSHAGAWDPLAAARLGLLLRRLRPDVSIAHGNRAVSLLRLAGASPIGAVLANYKINCAGLAAAFCPTLDLRRHAVERGQPASCAYHIPYMVEVPPALRRATRVTPVIGAMGRFVPKKGFDVFLAALGRLRSNGVLFRAVLAGDGPERGTLERFAAESGLRDLLSFPGWVTDKASFFSGIDVFCLPSHHEPFGIVLLEAMAHALPIVATDSEGPTEILRNSVDGLVVPRGDPERVAQALRALLADPADAARLGDAAYQRALQTYDVPRVGESLDRAVRETVERAREGSKVTA